MKKATATSQGNKPVLAPAGAGLSVNGIGVPGKVIGEESTLGRNSRFSEATLPAAQLPWMLRSRRMPLKRRDSGGFHPAGLLQRARRKRPFAPIETSPESPGDPIALS
jgi:hypothetical protein